MITSKIIINQNNQNMLNQQISYLDAMINNLRSIVPQPDNTIIPNTQEEEINKTRLINLNKDISDLQSLLQSDLSDSNNQMKVIQLLDEISQYYEYDYCAEMGFVSIDMRRSWEIKISYN